MINEPIIYNPFFFFIYINMSSSYYTTKRYRSVSCRVKQQVVVRQEYRCAGCGDLLEMTRQIDHIDPLWRGGSNASDNLQALCPNCHARKSHIEQKCIPRRFKGSALKSCLRCPLCQSVVSAYFAHRCDQYTIVDPSRCRLYEGRRRGQVVDLGRFVFDRGGATRSGTAASAPPEASAETEGAPPQKNCSGTAGTSAPSSRGTACIS